MTLMSPEQYLESLKDGREVWFRGQRVDDVTVHPVIGKASRHAAIDYSVADQPEHRDLAVYEEDGQKYSRYYKIPTSSDDLLKRSALIELCTSESDTPVTLIKEIGTDALFALLAVTAEMENHVYYDRVRKFYEYCRNNDFAVAVAQTDVKGNRIKRPSEQADPDLYLRVVERREDGVVVRGAKQHTSISTQAHEVIVLPTRAMGEGEEDWSIAFALPMNTPGIRLLASPFGDGPAPAGERPISAKHKMMETLTVFDDVFVPNERIFLDGERDDARHAGCRRADGDGGSRPDHGRAG